MFDYEMVAFLAVRNVFLLFGAQRNIYLRLHMLKGPVLERRIVDKVTELRLKRSLSRAYPPVILYYAHIIFMTFYFGE